VYRADPERRGTARLYVASADGSALGTLLSPEVAYNFEISPDGRNVAFPTGGGLDILSIDGGAPPVRIPVNTSRYEFTPDGARVVVCGNDLQVVTVDGSSSWILYQPCCSSLYTFRLSADGTQVLFVTLQGPPGGTSQILWHAHVDDRSPPAQVSRDMSVIATTPSVRTARARSIAIPTTRPPASSRPASTAR
jgi:hypothetical protein